MAAGVSPGRGCAGRGAGPGAGGVQRPGRVRGRRAGHGQDVAAVADAGHRRRGGRGHGGDAAPGGPSARQRRPGTGRVTASFARLICDWSDLLPPDMRDDADEILLAAAAGGATQADLAMLAQQMHERSAPPDTGGDDGPGGGDEDGFAGRRVWLDIHFRGAGELNGDLTPECAAALTALLDSLGRKAGPEDTRTTSQRHHDALEEACRRLIAGGLPDTAGQPTQVQLHMTLDQLRGLPGAADAERSFAAARAAGDGTPGWVSGPAAAEGYACDAQLVPVVTGHLDPAALDAVTGRWLAGLRRPGGRGGRVRRPPCSA